MSKLEEYVEKYTKLYAGEQKLDILKGQPRPGEVYGDGLEFLNKVLTFVDYTISRKRRAVSVLDYGCGQAMHTHKRNYNMSEKFKDTTIGERFAGMLQCYYCYDPAVKRYSVKPSPGSLFDVVAIADVLEHVPEEHVKEVIQDSLSFTKEDGIYIATVCNNPSHSHFRNSDDTTGENLHCTLKPMQWWIDMFHSVIEDKAFILIHNDHAYMKSIGSSATLQFHHHPSSKYSVDISKFRFRWVDKYNMPIVNRE